MSLLKDLKQIRRHHHRSRMVRKQRIIDIGMMKFMKAIKNSNLYLVDNFVGNFILYAFIYLINRTLLIQLGWNCMDDFSFMLINTMISMPVPGIV